MNMIPAVITIPLAPVLIHLGPVAIHWYGIGYAAALLLGAWVAFRHLVRRGIDPDTACGLLLGTIVAGLVGARLAFVVQSDLSYYLSHPQVIVTTWQGGMATTGAAVGGLAALVGLCRRWNVDVWLAVDGAALLAAVVTPIWRLGSIVNGDLVGDRSSLPWATQYTNPSSLAPHLGVPYQPAAAYQGLVLLCLLAGLLLLRRRDVTNGMLGVAYVGLYAASQLALPFLHQSGATVALGLGKPQFTALGVLVIGLPLLLVAWSSSRKEPVEARLPAPAANVGPGRITDGRCRGADGAAPAPVPLHPGTPVPRRMVALATILVALLTSCSATATPAARPTPAPGSIAPTSPRSPALSGSDRRIGLAAFRVAPLSGLSPDALAYLAGRDGRVGVAVLVPSRAQIYTNAAGGDGFHTASVIKVLIMMTVLRQAQDEGRELSPDDLMLLQQMIMVSDNDAANVLWSDLGGAEGVEAFLQTVGLSGIEPDSEGQWGASLATPVAMAELYYLLASGQALGPQQTQTAVDLLAQVDPTQRWGVTAGTGKDPTSKAVIGVKDGWYPDDSGWWVNSTGLVTTGDAKPAYTIAVMSDQQPTMEDAQATIEGVSARVHLRD